MRIAFVITELFSGGAERCLTELAIGLNDQGHEVRIFSIGSLPQGKRAELVERLQNARIEIETANCDGLLAVFKARRRLIDWLAESPPDICQSFLFHANCLTAMAFSQINRTQSNRSQSTLPDSGDRREGHCDLSSTRFAGGLRVAERKRMRCWLESRAIRRMDSLVCVSSAVAEFAKSSLNCPEDRIRVIPNGVDVQRFQTANPVSWPDVTGWDTASKVVLFVGRFHPQKGIELLQSQIDVIAPAGGMQKLLLIGDGPLRSSLQRWADLVGSDRCQLLKWQSDIAPFLRASSNLVLPSHYEGMPNVVLEAMAAGLPVVCSRVEGTQELLSHASEEQGFLPGDEHAMTRLIAAQLSDPDLAERLGEANLNRVRVDFSIPAMIDSYRSHYASLLASG